MRGPQHVYLGDIERSGYTLMEGNLLGFYMVRLPHVLVPQVTMAFLGCDFSPREERMNREAGRESL